MTTMTTEPAAPLREPDCTDPTHRRRALARARRCLTCPTAPEDLAVVAARPCLGCGTLIGYYACAPGYCRLCAHDPCWAPVR